MNQHKKTANKVAVIFAVLMILSTTAFALDARSSDRIEKVTPTLFVTSSGNLRVSFTVVAAGTMDIVGASKIDIKRYDGSQWITEETLTVRDYPEFQTTKAVRHSASVAYTPDYPGETYPIRL